MTYIYLIACQHLSGKLPSRVAVNDEGGRAGEDIGMLMNQSTQWNHQIPTQMEYLPLLFRPVCYNSSN